MFLHSHFSSVTTARERSEYVLVDRVVENELTLFLKYLFLGKVCSKFAKDSPVPSQVVQKINMKCVEARRPKRIRAAQKE